MFRLMTFRKCSSQRLLIAIITNWVAIVTPTDRPNSVRNRCVIEVCGGFFVLSRCFLDFSVGVGAFVIGPS